MSDTLLTKIRNCDLCAKQLPHEPRPVLSFSSKSKILIIGQAPGSKVHASGIPWDDTSGKRLHSWMGINEAEFYNPDYIAILPMGFCYPGKGTSGDLPPRPECAPQWHEQVFNHLNNIKLTVLIGQYAQSYYLPEKISTTEHIQNFKSHLPKYFVLPHPSPRNNIWLKKHPWFENDVIPQLQLLVKGILNHH